MGCDKLSNAKVDKVHLRALRAVYGDFKSSLHELLAFENEVTLHVRFVWKLLTEVFKSLHGLNPPLISGLFQCKSLGYTLRSGHQLTLPPTKTIKFGTRSISFQGSLTWNRLPREIKESTSVNQFKAELKRLAKNCCSCSLCV